MPQPPHDVDTLFEDLLQDLRPETVSMARKFKAFTRARKVTTPVQLLRLVPLELPHARNVEMAARLARRLGYVPSPDTLVRGQRAEWTLLSSPRLLRVDEFALRRGVTYATLLMELERHQPVAVLEGRTVEPLAKCLREAETSDLPSFQAVAHSFRQD